MPAAMRIAAGRVGAGRTGAPIEKVPFIPPTSRLSDTPAISRPPAIPDFAVDIDPLPTWEHRSAGRRRMRSERVQGPLSQT